MRVGVYIGNFQPEHGGAYTFIADVLGAFLEVASSSNHEFVVMCDAASVNALQNQVAAPNVSVVSVAMPGPYAKCLAGLKFFSPIFRWLWRWPGAVESVARHHKLELLWFLGVGAYECPETPYITPLWDLQHRYQPFFPEVSANGVWDKREQFYGYFLRRATYCLTGTETGKREIQYLYQLAEPRVRVFPLPTPRFALDTPKSSLDVRNRFGIENEYVFYPAQFWPHKNHVNLILALKWLKQNHGLNIDLVLTGSDKGNLEFIKHFAIEEGMAKQVHFLGFVSEDELIALYRQARMLAFVTYFGPDNIPPLEAFALGCPVVASLVGGAREQYGDAVLYVDPSIPEDIGDAIHRLHNDTDLRSALVAAGIIRSKQWTSINYVGELFKLINEFSTVRRNWP